MPAASTGDAIVRPLTAGDLDAAFALSSGAGWNQRLEDWAMLLRLAPTGCFTAISVTAIVGTAIGLDYGGFGWIAMMLVDPAWRGRGLGGQLLEAAMTAIPRDIPIRLDATPLGRPLYQRYGFVDERPLTRFVRERAVAPASAPHDNGARPMTRQDLDRIADADRSIFGGDRGIVLDWSRQHAPDYARVLEVGGRIDGYCLGRQGRLFDQVGPVVAAEPDKAHVLVAAALEASADRQVAVDAFDEERAFTSWLTGRGFRPQRPLYRMRRGAPAPARRAEAMAQVAILGPEFA